MRRVGVVALHLAAAGAAAYVAWRWPVQALVDVAGSNGWGSVLTWLGVLIGFELVLAIFGFSSGEFDIGGLLTFKRESRDPALPTAADLRATLDGLRAADTRLAERASEINGLLRDGLERLRSVEQKLPQLEQRMSMVEARLPPPRGTGHSLQSD